MIIHQNSVGTLWYRYWYWHLRINEGIDVTPEQASEFHEIAERKNLPVSPLLIDKYYSYAPTFDTLRLVSDYYPKHLSAIAWLVRSKPAEISSEVVKDTFLRALPTRIFYDLEEALEWLSQYRPKQEPEMPDPADEPEKSRRSAGKTAR